MLRGRTGAAGLAASSGAPVVPVGVWGTDEVWPRHERLPRMGNLVHPPEVVVRVGAPVEVSGADLEADTRLIMGAIADLLPDEARDLQRPTDDELTRGYPGGIVIG